MEPHHADMSSIELTEASTFADTSPEGQQFVRRKTDLSIYRDNSREGVWAERNVLSLGKHYIIRLLC